jgi:hypothetical protein
VGTISPGAVTIPIQEITSNKAISIFDRTGFMWQGYLLDQINCVCAAASDIDPVNKTVSWVLWKGLQHCRTHWSWAQAWQQIISTGKEFMNIAIASRKLVTLC